MLNFLSVKTFVLNWIDLNLSKYNKNKWNTENVPPTCGYQKVNGCLFLTPFLYLKRPKYLVRELDGRYNDFIIWMKGKAKDLKTILTCLTKLLKIFKLTFFFLLFTRIIILQFFSRQKDLLVYVSKRKWSLSGVGIRGLI